MFNIIKRFFNRPKPYQSALLDNRSDEEKSKDFLDIEFSYGQDDYEWKEETNFVDTPFYPYNQVSSLSCVALSWAIWLQEFWARQGFVVITSRKDGYFWRFNRPGGGMTAEDSVKLAVRGMGLESQVPSQNLGETAMNTPYALTAEILAEREKNRIKAGVFITQSRSIDAIAKASRHSPVSLFVFFDTASQYQEWWTPYPKVVNTKLNLYAIDTSRHHISVPSSIAYKVIGGVLINGVKHLKIQDSAGVGTGLGQYGNVRHVSEAFIQARCYRAYYAIPNDSEIKPNPPSELKWSGKRNLSVGSVGNDVYQLQAILQAEGLFNYPNPTGYFGGITRKAVMDLQNRYAHEILTPVRLKKGTGFVGASTRAWLETKYA